MGVAHQAFVGNSKLQAYGGITRLQARGGGSNLVFAGRMNFVDTNETINVWGYLDGETLTIIGNNFDFNFRDDPEFVREYKKQLYMFGNMRTSLGTNPNNPNFNHCAKLSKKDIEWSPLEGRDLASNAHVEDVAFYADHGTIMVCSNSSNYNDDNLIAFIAEYDGTNWIGVGSSASFPIPTIFDSLVNTCSPWQGTIVASNFKNPSPPNIPRIGRYNGDQTWSLLAPGKTDPEDVKRIRNIKVKNDPEDDDLLFILSDELGGKVFTWDDSDYATIGTGSGALDITSFDGGAAMCGSFTTFASVAAKRVIFWDGTTWTPLGSGFNNGVVRAIWEHEKELYAVGSFIENGEGEQCRFLAKYVPSEGKWIEPYKLTEDQVLTSASLEGIGTFTGKLDKK